MGNNKQSRPTPTTSEWNVRTFGCSLTGTVTLTTTLIGFSRYKSTYRMSLCGSFPFCFAWASSGRRNNTRLTIVLHTPLRLSRAHTLLQQPIRVWVLSVHLNSFGQQLLNEVIIGLSRKLALVLVFLLIIVRHADILLWISLSLEVTLAVRVVHVAVVRCVRHSSGQEVENITFTGFLKFHY